MVFDPFVSLFFIVIIRDGKPPIAGTLPGQRIHVIITCVTK